MVLKDFDRAREGTTQEVNEFLDGTWGIKDYTDLAPAVLLVREPGRKVFTAFPLTLLLEESDDEKWTAVVHGEGYNEMQVNGGKERGELELWIREDLLSGLDWESVARRGRGEVGEEEEVFVSDNAMPGEDIQEEGFVDFVKETFISGQGVTLKFFGTLVEPHSGLRRNFYMADVREQHIKFNQDHQLRLAKWLKAGVEDGTAVPFSRQELVTTGQEGKDKQPVGQQEPDDIPF